VSQTDPFDVIIAGAGLAGVAVATALVEFGYRIAIIDPGNHLGLRLGGELIHPQGVHALDQLGLLSALQKRGASQVTGFSVSFGATAESATIRLPYDPLSEQGYSALAIEHGTIRELSLSALSSLPRVQVFTATIKELDLNSDSRAEVTVSTHSGERLPMSSRLLIDASGGASHLSRLAGLVETRRRISTLVGSLLNDLPLPDPGYGHIFLGGTGPILAYQLPVSATRFMIDLPGSPNENTVQEACQANLFALPEYLRGKVAEAIATQQPVASASYWAGTRQITRGRMLLVGDSAGCCHPITASGLTFCARDALLLRDTIRDANGNIPHALTLYARRRRGRQRTRLALGQALYEVFCGQTPETRLIREGMRRYWCRSGRGRSVSIALLSSREDRIRVMLSELGRVIACGLGGRISAPVKEGRLSPLSDIRLVPGITRIVLRHAFEVLRTT
jgi:2-polyprenyl-6-methoxyphenol hydroxylase-like FAD-dependent oxidoreductase